MSGRKCYICEKSLDDKETFVIKLDDESFDLCEQHYRTSQKMLAHIDKMVINLLINRTDGDVR